MTSDLSESVAEFALKLLRQISTPESDVFLSPISISVALAMCYAGASGNTAEQMRSALFAKINNWVEEITRSKIKDLIAPGVLNALTRLVIVNAIYFKGDWKHKFDEARTIMKPFYSAPNRETKVDMMQQKKEFLYGEDSDVQVLGMPYKADHLVMFVLLPKERYGLGEFEKKLTGNRLFELIKNTWSTEVIVNEEGSEAAAATAVVMLTRCAVAPSRPKAFKADHPFLFLISDKKTNSLLFIGHFCA